MCIYIYVYIYTHLELLWFMIQMFIHQVITRKRHLVGFPSGPSQSNALIALLIYRGMTLDHQPPVSSVDPPSTMVNYG